MNRLRETLSQAWLSSQSSLLPWLTEELGSLTIKRQTLVTTLEQVRIEEFMHFTRGFPGCPVHDRATIAHAFIAKKVSRLSGRDPA